MLAIDKSGTRSTQKTELLWGEGAHGETIVRGRRDLNPMVCVRRLDPPLNRTAAARSQIPAWRQYPPQGDLSMRTETYFTESGSSPPASASGNVAVAARCQPNV